MFLLGDLASNISFPKTLTARNELFFVAVSAELRRKTSDNEPNTPLSLNITAV